VGLRAGLYGGVVEINNAQGLPTGIMGQQRGQQRLYRPCSKGNYWASSIPQIMLKRRGRWTHHPNGEIN